MSMIKEQIKELRQYASERKGEIADICNRAADTIEGLSEKLRASRYSDAEIQKMQELEQAEIEKAYELGRMEQETCEDEYIKVPKKALKYRTAGMVAYNAEWLKDHFDIERAVICGAQQPSENAISRQAAKGNLIHAIKWNDMPKLARWGKYCVFTIYRKSKHSLRN